MGTILSAWGERTRRFARAADEDLDALSTAAEAKRGVRVLSGSALVYTSSHTPACPPPSLGLAPCALMRAVTLSHTRSHTHTRVFLHLENPMGLPRGYLERSRVGSRG
jgi:hypothetical protein